jgi:hypothetical protein
MARKDDRRHRRAPVRLPVSIGRRAAALTADVSREGFCLETPAAVKPGQPLSGYVLHGEKELGWRGWVHWTEPGDPRLSTWGRVGVRFSWVSPGLRALLSISERAADSQKPAGRPESP